MAAEYGVTATRVGEVCAAYGWEGGLAWLERHTGRKRRRSGGHKERAV